MVYLDNIVIYSTHIEEHKEHIWKVFKTLIKAGLYYKLSKYTFNICKIDFLRYIINTNRVAIKKLWVIII